MRDVIRSFKNTGRGGNTGKFALRSRSASLAFWSPGGCDISPISIGNVGPMAVIRGGHGAELE